MSLNPVSGFPSLKDSIPSETTSPPAAPKPAYAALVATGIFANIPGAVAPGKSNDAPNSAPKTTAGLAKSRTSPNAAPCSSTNTCVSPFLTRNDGLLPMLN